MSDSELPPPASDPAPAGSSHSASGVQTAKLPAQTQRWIYRNTPRPEAAVRMICFPFAGGNAGIFAQWPELLPNIDVCAVQLPGRGVRFAEPAFTDIASLIAALADALAPLFDRQIVLFGHSMGASVAFELIHALPAPQRARISHLCVSARQPPHLPLQMTPIHDLPEAAFRAELAALNGTPREVLESEEMMQLVGPTLRADFQLIEQYRAPARPPLAIPISALSGQDDMRASPAIMAQWQQHTTAGFVQDTLPGGHFFITEAPQSVTSVLQARLM